jgi:hypothetical protein
MSRFLDLDAVVVPDLEVQLKGETYRVPGSPETERMLRWLSFQSRFEKASPEDVIELLQEIYDDLLEVFREYQPELEKLPIRNDQIMPLFEALFDASTEEEAPPTRPTRQRKPKS